MKSQRGITLIALVVTIVVLLILAGVSISMLSGENGIITQAEQSSTKNDNGTVAESLRLKLSEYMAINNGALSEDKMQLLFNDNIINDESIVNVEKLVGEKLKTGNGSNNKDVYTIEDNHLYYYTKKEEKIDLGNLGELGTYLVYTDSSLFEVDDEGRISLKRFDEYYNGTEEWTIEELVIPKEVDGKVVKIIGERLIRAASNCVISNLKSVIIPNTVTVIEREAFRGCDTIKNIVIPESVTSIGWGAFEDCINIKNISIPISVVHMDGLVFSGWKNDQIINIGYEVDNLPSGWSSGSYFKWNSDCNATINYGMNLSTSINIPEGTTSIEEGQFENYVNVEKVIIPNTITSIGAGAFAGCSNLKSITIPDSVIYIGEEAFYGCYNLSEINISGNVNIEKIGYSCIGWDSVWYNNQPDGLIYIGKILLTYKGDDYQSVNNIFIKEGTTQIADGALYGCIGVSEITIPSTVTMIGDYAFGEWLDSQIINVPYKENELPSGWSSNWNANCDAQINYLK